MLITVLRLTNVTRARFRILRYRSARGCVARDEVPRIARARGLDLWGERDESVGRVERKWRRRCDESPIAVTEHFARTARRPDGQTDGRRRGRRAPARTAYREAESMRSCEKLVRFLQRMLISSPPSFWFSAFGSGCFSKSRFP